MTVRNAQRMGEICSSYGELCPREANSSPRHAQSWGHNEQALSVGVIISVQP